MYDKTDTDVIERDQETTERRKKERFFTAPLFMAMGVVLLLAVVGVTIISRAKREREGKQAGVMAATYSARALPQELVGPVPVKAPPKFNHVIFRLGDEEIFRFVYEDGGDGRRYSFEVREGSS